MGIQAMCWACVQAQMGCWMPEINSEGDVDIGTVLAVLGYSDGIFRLRFSD